MFNDIELQHDGKAYSIKANEVLRLIAKVENVLSLPELLNAINGGQVPLAKLSMAYGTILRYAGCLVTDEQVYQSMFSQEDASRNAQEATTSLLLLMVPPVGEQPKKKKAAPSKKSTTRKKAIS